MDSLTQIILVIGISAIAIYFQSPLLSVTVVLPSWNLAWTQTDHQFIALFFAILGAAHIFNSINFIDRGWF